jgi:hypothetical protein
MNLRQKSMKGALRLTGLASCRSSGAQISKVHLRKLTTLTGAFSSLDAASREAEAACCPDPLSPCPTMRKASRVAIANDFRARNPSLSSEQAALAANVSLQMTRGMMALYEGSEAQRKSPDRG